MASSAKRVSKHRENLRAQGLKPVQIWVYDMDNPEVRRRMDEWMAHVRADPVEREFQELWEQAQDWEGWDDGGFTEEDLKP